MSEKIITCCDYCNKDQSTSSAHQKGGYVECDTETAISEFDWVMTPHGIKCLNCQDEDSIN